MSPDVDIVLQYIPGVDPLWASFFHRTMTHSPLFAILISPIVGYVLSKMFKKQNIPRHVWWLVTLISIASHIFLDRCTTYGVWLLWPFVDIWYEARIINVVDLFFTIPLMWFLLWYLLTSRTKKSNGTYMRIPWLRFLWVTFAWVYLLMMTLQQFSFKQSLRHDMQQAWVWYTDVFAAPQFMQPFLWYGMVNTTQWTYKLNHSSVFDTKPRTYETIPTWHERVKNITSDENVSTIFQKLQNRSHGWYQLELSSWSVWTWDSHGPIMFRDLRFGRMIWWDKQSRGEMVFSYAYDPMQHTITHYHHHDASTSFAQLWKKHWQRVWWN